MAFYVCCVSLSTMSLRFIHVVPCYQSVFQFFLWLSNIWLYGSTTFYYAQLFPSFGCCEQYCWKCVYKLLFEHLFSFLGMCLGGELLSHLWLFPMFRFWRTDKNIRCFEMGCPSIISFSFLFSHAWVTLKFLHCH